MWGLKGNFTWGLACKIEESELPGADCCILCGQIIKQFL